MARDVDRSEVDSYQMPLLAHLEELRWRLVVSLVTLVVGMIVSVLLAETLFAILTAPVRAVLTGAEPHWVDPYWLAATAWIPDALKDVEVKGTLAITASPLEGVYTWFRVGIMGGALLASPVLAWQVWSFVAPGLYKTERRVVLPLTVASTFLFAVGAAFAFFVLLPVALPFFLQVLPAEAVLSIEGYLKTVVRMLVAFGLVFQLPVGTWFLANMGLIDARDMIHAFRYAVVALFVVAALITPPDVITQGLLGIPLVLLYVVGIGVAWVSSTKVRAKD